MFSEILEIYTTYGISLKEQGINGSLLPKKKIDNVISFFEKDKIIILGGDIYIKNKETYSIIDSWFYNDENYFDSILKTREYLDYYKNDYYFILFVLKK